MLNITKNSAFYIILFLGLIFLLTLLSLVFIPKSYPVERLVPEEGRSYWQLPTGSNIHYIKIPAQGEAKATPILYLHGGPGGRIKESLIAPLRPLAKAGYPLYFYDQIGSGYSDRLSNIEDYTVERHYRDLTAIIHEIGAEQVILLGQSWGALLTTVYITAHPESVAKAIFTGPGPMLPIQPERARIKAPDHLQLRPPGFSNQQGNTKAYNLRMKFARWYAQTFGKKWISDNEADDFFTFLNSQLNKSAYCDLQKAQPSSGGGGYYAHIMTLKSFRQVKDQRLKTQQVQTALLVMKGQCDNQAWGFTEEYLNLFPNATLNVIPDAGHFIADEQETLYLEAIVNFLSL